jgi:thiol-disulfide isomerase/thioredoxin
MNLKFKIVVPVLVAALMLISGCDSSQQSSLLTRPAPDFETKTLSGESISLSSLKGKLVLINFWSTTCPPCLEEMPQFEELQKDWAKRDDVKLLMIDAGEAASTVSQYLKKFDYTFTVLLDPGFEVGKKYGIRYTPTTLIIDKDGILRISILGPFKNKAAIEKQLAQFLTN